MILNVALGLISLLALVLTVYYGRKAARLEKARKTLTWPDLQVIADSIAFSLKKDQFVPEVILAPGLRGAAIAELLLHGLDRSIPVFVGISFRHATKTKKLILTGYEGFEITDDWEILIPRSIADFSDKKVLIVDDFCLTGEFFENLREHLVNSGFKRDRIRVFCAVITAVTRSGGRTPEYYSLITEDDNFCFPWGKASVG